VVNNTEFHFINNVELMLNKHKGRALQKTWCLPDTTLKFCKETK